MEEIVKSPLLAKVISPLAFAFSLLIFTILFSLEVTSKSIEPFSAFSSKESALILIILLDVLTIDSFVDNTAVLTALTIILRISVFG